MLCYSIYLLGLTRRWWTTKAKDILNPEQVDDLSRFNLPS